MDDVALPENFAVTVDVLYLSRQFKLDWEMTPKKSGLPLYSVSTFCLALPCFALSCFAQL